MGNKMPIPEQSLKLAAVYMKINEEGRDILDKVIQKLSEIHWTPEKTVLNATFSIFTKEL